MLRGRKEGTSRFVCTHRMHVAAGTWIRKLVYTKQIEELKWVVGELFARAVCTMRFWKLSSFCSCFMTHEFNKILSPQHCCCCWCCCCFILFFWKTAHVTQGNHLLLHVPAACPLCMFTLHVHVACPRCMSPLHVPYACPLCMSPLHVPTACPRCMSPLHFPSACPRCMTFCMPKLHGRETCPLVCTDLYEISPNQSV